MTSNRDEPSRSSRIVRAVYRLVSTNRLPLEARLSTNSCSTRRRPGKLSNVRSSRNSSSRNVAGSPALVRARAKKASVASKAPRAVVRRAFADRKRRGRHHRAQKPFGCRRGALDVDRLRRGPAESIAQAAAAASCGRCRNRRRAPESATATRRERKRCGASVCYEGSTCTGLNRSGGSSRRKTDIKKRRARCQIENKIFFA